MRRIWIDASLCDGCLNCTLACMNAHQPDRIKDPKARMAGT